MPPAQFRRISTEPNVSTAFFSAASTSGYFRMSTTSGRTLPPEARIPSAAFSRPYRLTSHSTTLAPASASFCPESSPIPDAPPVIIAVLPENSIFHPFLFSPLFPDLRSFPRSMPRPFFPIKNNTSTDAPQTEETALSEKNHAIERLIQNFRCYIANKSKKRKLCQ